jgi:hypothetical protein
MKRELHKSDLKKIKTIPLKERSSKVTVRDFCKPYEKGGTFKGFLDTLPAFLAVNDLKAVADRVCAAHRNKRPVIFGMGAHVIKVGLSPLIINLMQRGLISCIALNGAGAIHDVEIALAGKTSEDVAASLHKGKFGMALEAGELINKAVEEGLETNGGMGASIGKRLLQVSAPYVEMSILAMAAKHGIPVTVHVSIGSDTIHMHPTFDGAATGKLSHNDFQTFAALVSELEGGVFLNVGSAVVIPEVFLKAFSLASTAEGPIKQLTTVNMDFIRHYRPSVNVVERPTLSDGKGFHLIGHHEIMLPLLTATILEGL